MTIEAVRALQDYVAREERRPFGDAELVSRRILQPFSFAGQEAAENLLAKAARALAAGERERTRVFVERAARLPFDDHEGTAPVAMAAHMALFCLVVDTLEDSDLDDARWLEAAVAVLTEDAGQARFDMRDVLTAIDQDYQVAPAERRRLRSVIASIPAQAELRDLAATMSTDELTARVMAILTACRTYAAALE